MSINDVNINCDEDSARHYSTEILVHYKRGVFGNLGKWAAQLKTEFFNLLFVDACIIHAVLA